MSARGVGIWECGVKVSVLALHNGHRSLYVAATLGRRTYWLMRWDVARAPLGRFRSRDGLMGWTWGAR